MPGWFDTQSFCPYCGFRWGKHAKICLDCDRAWFPIFAYCPECGKQTGTISIDELTSIELGWNPHDDDRYEAGFESGVFLYELAYGNESKGFTKVKEEYDLKSLITYPAKNEPKNST